MPFENDWELLRAAAPELQNYILSTDIYRPIRLASRAPGSAQTPQLTIGNLALSQARLSALALSGNQQRELDELTGKIARLREEWKANWARKASREYASRLNLWREYLRELRGDPRQQAAFYASEVRNRAILLLLLADMLDGISQELVEQLELADTILRGLTGPGPFIWEPEAAGAFPEAEYWFLYLKIRK